MINFSFEVTNFTSSLKRLFDHHLLTFAHDLFDFCSVFVIARKKQQLQIVPRKQHGVTHYVTCLLHIIGGICLPKQYLSANTVSESGRALRDCQVQLNHHNDSFSP